MSENKTKATKSSVAAFVSGLEDPRVRKDCHAIIEIMKSVSKLEPVMRGPSIIGFGTYHYVYESGREGDTVIVGFSPRKQNIAFYLRGGLVPLQDELARLGKYTTGKGCLYVRTLEDVNVAVLKRIHAKSYRSGTSG